MTHSSLFVRGSAFARATQAAALAAGFLAFTGCSDSTGSAAETTGSHLAFSTGSSASSSAALTASIPVTKNGHTLDLTQVTIVVERASLKRSSTDLCGADDDERGKNDSRGRGRCGEVKVGPALVDLPLDGKVVTLPGNAVPEGTYREIEVRISLVRLVGTYDGKAFDVTVPVHAKSEVEFATPIVVDADSTVSVTVNLPVDTWLVNSDGSLVDPNTLFTSPMLMASVKHRIATSIRAFEDNDHDGREDHFKWWKR